MTPFYTQGESCDKTFSSDAGKIAKLQCFAEALYNGDVERNENLCVRRIETNWSATTPEEFILDSDGPRRAATLFVLAKFDYNGADAGVFEESSVYHDGFQTGNNWTNCKVREHFKMSLKKRNDTTLVSEFVNSRTLLDTEKDACVADAKSADSQLQIGTSRTLMLMNKQ